MHTKETAYPWLRLLELEFEEELKPIKTKRPGRPKNPFPRKRVRASLTEDEQAALDELVMLFSQRMDRPIHRGHLIAFMTFRLRHQLQHGKQIALSEDVNSFIALAKYLDGRGR